MRRNPTPSRNIPSACPALSPIATAIAITPIPDHYSRKRKKSLWEELFD